MFRSAADHQDSGELGAVHGLDMEENTEEMKQRLECQVGLTKKQISAQNGQGRCGQEVV